MMSDLAEIAAAAGIAIIDSDSGDGKSLLGALGDGGDVRESAGNEGCQAGVSHPLPVESGDWSQNSQIEEWDTMFSCRYTESDPDYASTLENAEASLHPPCVAEFNCRRQRNDSRNWIRDSNSQRRYSDRGGQGGYRNRGNYHNDWNRQDWGGGGGGGGRRDRGDYRHHSGPQGYGDYHQRDYGNYHRGGYGDQRHRSYGDQRNRSRSGEEHRERSPQR